jgi:beta-N-acetylhexosaminidase
MIDTGKTVSRRRFLRHVGVGAIGLAAAACAAIPPRATPTRTPAISHAPSASPTRTPVTEPDLEAKIAQMLLVGFRGLTVTSTDSVIRDVTELGLGGVVLFDRDQPTGASVRNIESPDQLRTLTADLQAAAARGPTDLPLLIAVDQEGGRVARLRPDHGFAGTESAADLGAQADPAQTSEAAAIIAATLADAGITLNLAPIVDLDRHPASPIIGALDRSFGADPELVAQQAAAFVDGHRRHGVRTALKHFPGHGSAAGDTHAGIVDVTDAWSDVELEPFERLIASGHADAVLTAHVFNATLDPDYPATLSAATITGILRQQLGFDGPVISDDLQMGAIREAYGYSEAVALAIEAGIDILTIANQQVFEADIVRRTIDVVAAHVASGRIGEERIDQAYRRIRELKGA